MKASYITTCLNTMTPDLGYDSYTDEELVILVQTGYPSAKIVLCHRYVPLITKYSHVSQLQTIQSELEATLWECFLEAIQTYDTTGTVPFSGFVKSRIHYCEMNLFRRMRTQWTHEATCIQNEEESDPLSELPALNSTEEEALDHLQQVALIEALSQIDPIYASILIDILYHGKHISQLAKEYGISRQAMHKKYKKAISLVQQRI